MIHFLAVSDRIVSPLNQTHYTKVSISLGFSGTTLLTLAAGVATALKSSSEKKNQLPGGEECELSYLKPNFLESGVPKSNQAKPMHHGIMQKMTQLYKMTSGEKYCQA